MENKEIVKPSKIISEIIGGYVLYGIIYGVLFALVYGVIEVGFKLVEQPLFYSVITICISILFNVLVINNSIKTTFKKRTTNKKYVSYIMQSLVIAMILLCSIITLIDIIMINVQITDMQDIVKLFQNENVEAVLNAQQIKNEIIIRTVITGLISIAINLGIVVSMRKKIYNLCAD